MTASEPTPGIGVLELVNASLKRWKLLVVLPFLMGVLGVVLALLLPKHWAASAAFVPESRSGSLPSSVASLAGQFGLSIGDDASQSPNFYADVLQSREILEEVVGGTYPLARGDSVELLEFLEASGTTARAQIESAARRLKSATLVTVDPRTNIVRVRVEQKDPVLAAAVANRYVEAIHRFNQTTRRSQARARRVFAEQRIGEAQTELQQAEDALQAWLMRNRSYEGYPELESQHARLQRRVTLRQEVYLSLFREFENARLEEVNDTPVITVVESAVPPARRSRPKRTVLVLMMTVLGGLVGLSAALAAEYLSRLPRSDEAAYDEFRRLSGAFRTDLSRALRRRRDPPTP